MFYPINFMIFSFIFGVNLKLIFLCSLREGFCFSFPYFYPLVSTHLGKTFYFPLNFLNPFVKKLIDHVNVFLFLDSLLF